MSLPKIIYGLLKIVALLVGGLITIISLMAVLGLFVSNQWAQLGIALVVALGLPALVADRVLPPQATKSDGLISDVFAVMWVGVALLFVGLSSLTGNMLRDKAMDFHSSGNEKLASITMWVAGPGKEAPQSLKKEAPVKSLTPVETDDPKKTDEKPKDESAKAPADKAQAQESPKTEDEAVKNYTPAELFQKMSPAVVTITVSSPRGQMGGGTGFIIDTAGIVVTNHHVIADSSTVSVKLLDGQWASKVELLVQDKEQDLAILKITSDADLFAAALGDSDQVQVGEQAISIGNPLGLEHTLTDGLVSARRTYEGRKMIQMSTPVSPGNSGGPLFNLQGEVIGVSTAQLGSYSRGQNLNLAVPINQVKTMLTDDYPDRKRVGGGSPAGKGSW